MSDYFQSQTNIIAFDIGLDVFLKAWPIVFPRNKLSSFIETKVAS